MREEELIGIPKRFWDIDWRKLNIPKDQCDKLNKWANNKRGNCILKGPTGRGKTYCAVALMYCFNQWKKIAWSDQRFVELSALNQEWLANMSDYYLNVTKANILKSCKVLVLDDIGVRRPSDGFLDYLFSILNHRSNDPELITIYTTNLNSKEWQDLMSPRVVSRAAEKTDGVVIEFERSDLRLNMPQERKIEHLPFDKMVGGIP